MHCGELSSHVKKYGYKFESNSGEFIMYQKGNIILGKQCKSEDERKQILIITNDVSISEKIKNAFIQNGFKYDGSFNIPSGEISFSYRKGMNAIDFTDEFSEDGIPVQSILSIFFE